MRTIFNLIKVAIVFGIICGCFFLLINQTFIYEIYKGELMEGEGISIPRFMYFLKEDNDLNVTFITPLSKNYLNEQKNNLLNNLTSCYGKYYYDENNNITITKYDIVDNKYYRDVALTYAVGNYCSEEYILSDMWVYEYNSLSTFVNGDITEKAMTKLIDQIYNAERENNPEISDYNNQINYKVICKLNGIDYELYFQDFNEDELLVIKKMNGIENFGVYKIENIVELLNSLEKTTS